MAEDKTFQRRIQKIEALVAELDRAGDPNLRAGAKSLVQLIMDLHGRGLERVMEIVTQAGDAGERIIERLGRDDLVSSLLLLYGLHPLDFETRVRQALEKQAPSLRSQGARAELLSVADGVVRVQLLGTLKGCGASGVKAALEEAIYDAAPDLAGLVVEGDADAPSAAFVPLSNLLQPWAARQPGSERP